MSAHVCIHTSSVRTCMSNTVPSFENISKRNAHIHITKYCNYHDTVTEILSAAQALKC